MSDAAPGRGWTGYGPAGPGERLPEPGDAALPEPGDAALPEPGEAPFADAIVVAAGSSSRMGGVDKLDAVVGGLPLLAHAVRAIAAAPEVRRIILVTSLARLDAMHDAPWVPAKLELGLTGGARRQDSVGDGFVHLLLNPPTDGSPDPEVVLVHDGARPLVPTALVSAIARAAREHGAAIPIVPFGDTIKRMSDDGTVVGVGDRAALGAAQTPQGIRTEILRAALDRYPAAGPETFTDEASLLEACRIPVHAIPGDERNIKVTLPGDLERVEQAMAASGQAGLAAGPASAGLAGPSIRIGFGADSHPFGPGSGLALGGLVVEAAPRLRGHSDGDVVLHAVADALLGAAALGDLGRLFPAGPETPSGIASTDLLVDVASLVAAAGFTVASLDCTIVAARPRLAGLLPSIGDRIAELLSIDATAINVKASTGNLDGMEGAGRGISATVVAVLSSNPADR